MLVSVPLHHGALMTSAESSRCRAAVLLHRGYLEFEIPSVRAPKRRAVQREFAILNWVLRVVATDLWDPEKMRQHFLKLGKLLLGKEHARRLSEDTAWFTQ